MVRIRLRKTGLRNQPSYRIVAADKESPRDGRFLENLGFYNPRTEPSTIEIDEEKIYKWLEKGALPSESVTQIFNSVGVLDRYKKYKEGSSIDSLLKESKTFFESRTVDPKTRRDAPEAK